MAGGWIAQWSLPCGFGWGQGPSTVIVQVATSVSSALLGSPTPKRLALLLVERGSNECIQNKNACLCRC
eukprot:8622178-Lingulodinium_polyedra.AAC.1